MRTTVTLDPDVAAKLRRVTAERGISFKEALNSALRAGLGAEGGRSRPYRLQARRLGLRAGIDLDKALRLAGAMEDDESVRKLELRK
jgi:Arc/MetJ family transcription regulator